MGSLSMAGFSTPAFRFTVLDLKGEGIKRPLTDPLDAEVFKYVNGGKVTVEVAHRVFCIKYGSIWVTDFKRAMADQERCLPSGHTKQGGRGSDPGRRGRGRLHLIACWERSSTGKAQRVTKKNLPDLERRRTGPDGPSFILTCFRD